MPLIQDLKNPAMRDRHWAQIKTDVQKPFDHTGRKNALLPFKCSPQLLVGGVFVSQTVPTFVQQLTLPCNEN